MAFIKLMADTIDIAVPAGQGIIKVSETVFQNGPNSEWAKFVVNPHQWLRNHKYRYVDKDYREIGDGSIPSSLELVPVYDSATRMHIRIPWKQTLQDGQAPGLRPEPNYQQRFPAILAHYWMRSCR